MAAKKNKTDTPQPPPSGAAAAGSINGPGAGEVQPAPGATSAPAALPGTAPEAARLLKWEEVGAGEWSAPSCLCDKEGAARHYYVDAVNDDKGAGYVLTGPSMPDGVEGSSRWPEQAWAHDAAEQTERLLRETLGLAPAQAAATPMAPSPTPAPTAPDLDAAEFARLRLHDMAVRDAEEVVAEAEERWEECKKEASAAGKEYDKAVSNMRAIVRQRPGGTLFDQTSAGPVAIAYMVTKNPDAQADAPAAEVTAWKTVPVEELGLSKALLKALKEPTVDGRNVTPFLTIGDIAAYTATPGKSLVDLKGIGQDKADKIADAITAHQQAHPEMWPQVKAEPTHAMPTDAAPPVPEPVVTGGGVPGPASIGAALGAITTSETRTATAAHPEGPWLAAPLDGLIPDPVARACSFLKVTTVGHWLEARQVSLVGLREQLQKNGVTRSKLISDADVEVLTYAKGNGYTPPPLA